MYVSLVRFGRENHLGSPWSKVVFDESFVLQAVYQLDHDA